MIQRTDSIIAIGGSMGAVEAIRELLLAVPPDAPPIIITQHMPAVATKRYAKRLDGLCRVAVKEAEDGDPVRAGRALIAPGDFHMTLERSGALYVVRLNRAPPVNWSRPSVDVLFHSVATCAGNHTIGVILTGMGHNGAEGLLAMKHAGAGTIAEDESTCAIFGMPHQAIKLGAVHHVLPLHRIAAQMLRLAHA